MLPGCRVDIHVNNTFCRWGTFHYRIYGAPRACMRDLSMVPLIHGQMYYEAWAAPISCSPSSGTNLNFFDAPVADGSRGVSYDPEFAF